MQSVNCPGEVYEFYLTGCRVPGCGNRPRVGQDYCWHHRKRWTARYETGESGRPETNVYFIRAGKDGPVKIGVADDVAKRRAELQTGCPDDLRILAYFRAPAKMERALHRKLKDKKKRGEWFEWCPEIELLVALVRDGRIANVEMFANTSWR